MTSSMPNSTAPARLVTDYAAGDSVETFLGVRSFQVRTASNGRQYVACDLFDSSGPIAGRIWGFDGDIHKPGDIVKVRGVIEEYEDQLQLKVMKIRAATEEEATAHVGMIVPTAPISAAEIHGELAHIVDGMGDPWLKEFCGALFQDLRFMIAPAAKRMHHAYRHGLAYHTLCMCRAAEAIAPLYPQLNRDLLVAGCMVHDIGKVIELSSGLIPAYTDYGSLVGHIALGVELVQEIAKNLADSPHVPLLKHMVVSHHGERDKGAAVEPATAEAIALSAIDRLDAHLEMFWSATRGKSGWVEIAGRRLLAGDPAL